MTLESMTHVELRYCYLAAITLKLRGYSENTSCSLEWKGSHCFGVLSGDSPICVVETSDGSPATQWLRSQSRDKAAFACQQAEADQWLAVLVCESVRQDRVDGAQGKTLKGLQLV